MRKSNTTDRLLLIPVAANKNANGKAEQNMAYCPGMVKRFVQQTSGFICSYNSFFKFQ